MNKIRFIVLTIATAAAGWIAPVAARAQSDGRSVAQSVSLLATNGFGTTVPGVLTTNAFLKFAPGTTNGAFIDCSKQQNMTVEFDVTGGTATSNQTFWLAPTLGVNYQFDSNQVIAVNVLEPGSVGTNKTVLTNLPAGDYAGWYIVAASNASWTTHSTNSVNYYIKTKSP